MHNRDLDIDSLLKNAGIAPTSNRVLVARTLARADSPMSLADLEDKLDTLDKSSISRVLSLLNAHSVTHTFEDGRGVAKYELCHSPEGHQHSSDDMHIHFYCTQCRQTFCFEDIAVPKVEIPADFEINSVNYMLKGLCPECRKKNESKP